MCRHPVKEPREVFAKDRRPPVTAAAVVDVVALAITALVVLAARSSHGY